MSAAPLHIKHLTSGPKFIKLLRIILKDTLKRQFRIKKSNLISVRNKKILFMLWNSQSETLIYPVSAISFYLNILLSEMVLCQSFLFVWNFLFFQ